MAKDRINQKIKQQKLDEIIQLMGQGYMRYQILTMLAEKWNCKERYVQIYYDKSNQILKAGFTDEDLIAGYKEIHRRTMDESPAIALKAYDSIAKLKKGAYSAPPQNEIIIKFDGENKELKSNDNK